MLAVSPAQGAEILRLSHLNPQDPAGNTTAAMAGAFEHEAEAATQGRVDVAIYPDGRLGKEQEILEQMKLGLVQSAIVSMGGLASFYPEISVLDVPFAYQHIDATYRVFDGAFGQKLSADIEQKTGYAVLGYGDSGGFFAITNNRHPIHTLEDMKGLRLRTMTLPSHQRMMESLGAQPLAIAWPEVYTSLETGVADGQMNPIPVIALAHLEEVQEYLSLTQHLFTPYIWVFRREFLDRLSPEDQAALQEAVHRAVTAGRDTARAIEASDRGLKGLEKRMKVNSLPDAERARFRDAALPAHEAYVRENFGEDGAVLLKAYLAAIKEAESTHK